MSRNRTAPTEPTIDKSGAWDVPIQNYVKECKLVVMIFNIEHDTIEKEIQIDYGKYEDRKFLGRITYWAVTNGRTIETMNYQDWKDSK